MEATPGSLFNTESVDDPTVGLGTGFSQDA